MSLAFSIVTQALGIAAQIYQAEEAEEYRSQVLAGIDAIETQIKEIEDELRQILAQTKLNHLATETQGADGKINELYNRPELQDWLKGSQNSLPSLPTDLLDDIKGTNGVGVRDLLTYVDLAIMGTLTREDEPWLQIFTESASAPYYVSKCELVYRFFATYLIPLQLKGLTLLKAANYLDDDWKLDRLTEKLKAQGKKCQEIANQCLTADDLWSHSPHYDQLDSHKIRWWQPVDGAPSLPDGHVLTGYQFIEDEEGRVCLRLYHGKLNEFGSVDKTDWIYSLGDNGILWDKDLGTHGYYLYKGPLELEAGWVATGLALTTCSHFWVQVEHYGPKYYYGVVPALRAVQLQPGGGLNYDTQKWVTPSVDFPQGEQDAPRHGVLDVPSFAMGTGYNNSSFNPSPSLATPLTGVQFGSAFTPTGKVSVHQFSYDPDQD